MLCLRILTTLRSRLLLAVARHGSSGARRDGARTRHAPGATDLICDVLLLRAPVARSFSDLHVRVCVL